MYDTVPLVPRNPDVRCVTMSLPAILLESLERQSIKAGGQRNVSYIAREKLTRAMLEVDPEFARQWHSKYRGA